MGSAQALLRALEDGTPVLVEGVQEDIDPLIDSLLSRKIFTMRGVPHIQVRARRCNVNMFDIWGVECCALAVVCTGGPVKRGHVLSMFNGNKSEDGIYL